LIDGLVRRPLCHASIVTSSRVTANLARQRRGTGNTGAEDSPPCGKTSGIPRLVRPIASSFPEKSWAWSPSPRGTNPARRVPTDALG
jgi:hypothetical protein